MILDTFDVTAKMMPFKEKIYIDNDSKDIKHAILTDPVIDHLRSIISDVQDTPEINLPESFAEFLSDQLIPRNETKRDTKKSEDSVQIKKSVIKKDSSFENLSSDVDYDAQSDSIILTKEDDKINASDNKTDSPRIIRNPLIYLEEEQNKLFFKLNNDNNVIPRLEKKIQKPFTVKTNIEGCYLRLELEIAGECKDGDFRFNFIEDKEHNNVILIILGVVTNNLQNNNQKDIIHEDTRRFGEFEIVTKPIPLGNLKFYGFEDPEFMKDPPFGMKIMTFKLKRDKTDPSLTRR